MSPSAFPHRLSRHGRPRERIDRELDRFGLSDWRAAAVRTLSGGNRRRVELARALLHRPGLLLMDEPTVGLDPGSRQGLLHHVRALLRERSMGVLWATHLLDEAEQADRVIVLHRGRVVAAGHPSSLSGQNGAERLEQAFFRIVDGGAPEAGSARTGPGLGG